MECTGERYMPEFDGDWTLEHMHRYLLARELAGNKAVLDIASGEGYGARMLADVSANVVGVDISQEAVTLAAEKYAHPRLSFVQGSALAIPLADASVDLVTSFETIEHLTDHESMLREIKRVLRPGGMFVVSSPDKYVYSDLTGYKNEYHVRELYRDEFAELLRVNFNRVRMFGQRVVFGSAIGSEEEGAFVSWRKGEMESRIVGLADAEYIIALAGDEELPSLPSSILKTPQEQSDQVRDLNKKIVSLGEEIELHCKDITALNIRISGLDKEIERHCTDITALNARIADLDKEIELHCTDIIALNARIAGLDKEIELHCTDITALNQRISGYITRANERDIQLTAANERIFQTLERAACLDQHVAKLEAELGRVYASRSWRITAPMRFVVGKLRNMLRRKSEQIPPVPAAWPPDVRSLEKTLHLEESSGRSILPLGVFLHIYYVDVAEEMVACLRNLPETARIHVSTDTEEKREILGRLFTERGIADRTEFRVCPNKGWDLAPFLIGFADRIMAYPLILRLHSKRSTHIGATVGDEWRKMLFASLAGSPERVNAVMKAFEQDPKLGMACPPVVEYYRNSLNFGGNFTKMQELLQRYGVTIEPDTPIDFPVGSMFWCRPKVLAPWLDMGFSYDDFTPTEDSERDGSLAHALERLLLFGCGIAGFSWARLL